MDYKAIFTALNEALEAKDCMIEYLRNEAASAASIFRVEIADLKRENEALKKKIAELEDDF